MSQADQHRIEELEAAVRDYRQALRMLANAVLAGFENRPEALARKARIMLGENQPAGR